MEVAKYYCKKLQRKRGRALELNFMLLAFIVPLEQSKTSCGNSCGKRLESVNYCRGTTWYTI